MSHTPGPWKELKTYVRGNTVIIHKGEKENKYVGEVEPKNAALIAAAPDLLEACEAILADAEKFVCWDDRQAHIGPVHAERIRSAVRKARGE